jgi:hypothetical protein
MKTQELKSTKAPQKEFSNTLFYSTKGKSEPVVFSMIKRWKCLCSLVFTGILCSCNNSDQLVQQYKALHEHDSLLMLQTQADDSTIRGDVHNLSDIQSNLDEIKTREKILTVHGQSENKTGNTTIEDIKAINKLIIKSNREVAALHQEIKQLSIKDADMENTIIIMANELTEKDTEISALLSGLSKINNSYTEVTRQFNDSIAVLQNQNARIGYMINTMNTVYYAIGTEKELKDNKVITETGGFVGLGKNKELTPDKNTSYFTKTDLTKLNIIPLNAKFKKLLTTHPAESYKITGDKKADSLVITNQSAFWSENKYLVIAVK